MKFRPVESGWICAYLGRKIAWGKKYKMTGIFYQMKFATLR